MRDSANTHLVRLDSRTREPTSVSNTDFTTITLPFHTVSLRIIQVILPNLFTNIQSSPPNNNNSTFLYETGGVPTSFVIPDGFYSISTLIDYIETQLSALVITFTIDPDTSQLTLTNGGGATFEVINSDDGNIIADVLGITITETVESLGTTTFGNPPNLFSHNQIYVSSRRLCNSFNLISQEQRLPIIAVVPIDVPYGGIINYQPADPQVIYFESNYPITEADIQIVNHYGEVLHLPSNHHINILIEAEKFMQVA